MISIADGDTITILTGKTRHKIRLYGIDTPEKAQAFGKAAKKHTAKLVAGKTVDVTTYDTDRYGRTVGVVVADGANVNQSLISAGYAWQYQKYCKASFCDDWLRLEDKSRTSRIGLWSDSLLTQKKAILHNRPVVHLDMAKVTATEGVDLLETFIRENSIEVLNVAGSRGSKDPEIYGQTFQVVEKAILRSE